jgi:hypothetical protein
MHSTAQHSREQSTESRECARVKIGYHRDVRVGCCGRMHAGR